MNFELVYRESPDGRDFWIAFPYSDTHWRVMGTAPHKGWISNEEATEWDALGAAPQALSVQPSSATVPLS